MSKTIETIFRNGRIELPADVHLPEDTRVTVIVPDNATHGTPADPAYSIPDLASDIGPPDLARNLEHYLYGHQDAYHKGGGPRHELREVTKRGDEHGH
jgi:hypothetical protein